MSDRKRRPAQTGINLDLGLGGLLGNLGELIEAAAKLAEQAEAAGEDDGEGRTVERTGEFRLKGLGDKAQGVYGFSIRTGPGGTPARVQPFGNIRKTEEGPVVADVREPLVDVFDEGEEFLVVAELPGVNDAQIAVSIEGDILTVETTGERRYAKELLLAAPVEAGSLRRSYTNGILELRLKKA